MSIAEPVCPGAEAELLAEQEVVLFGESIREMNRQGIPYMLGGAFGVYFYTNYWRNTKDLDFIVPIEARDRAVQAIGALGVRDYFEKMEYDRGWIHRFYRDETIVDVIWSFANYVAPIDAAWMERAVPGYFLGEPVHYPSPADVIWMKMYVFQRMRCDWTDILNVVRGVSGQLDWWYLLNRLGEDWRLLGGLVDVYDWLCPDEHHFIPQDIRAEMAERRLLPQPGTVEAHARLFDSRPWLTEPGCGLQNVRPAAQSLKRAA